MDSLVKIIRGIIQIGGLDPTNVFRLVQTKIRNDGLNALVVDALTTIVPGPGTVPSVSANLRYVDINVANGGIARDTTISTSWVKAFGYSGSGLLLGVVLNIEEKNNWRIRFKVDDNEIFGSDGILTKDLIDDGVYDLDDGGSPMSSSEGRLGISMEEHDRFVWTPTSNFPLRYSQYVEIYIKRDISTPKKLKAGLVILTKET